MKKILVIHTKYQELGGEDVAVENEMDLLKDNFKIKELFFSNNIDNYFFDTFSLISNNNKKSINKLLKTIDEFKPDYAYVHNTWFKASIGIFRALENSGVKTILKLHNFRYSCMRSFLARNHFKDLSICNACGSKRSSMGIINRYYENSFLKSLFVANYGRKYFDIIKKKNIKIFVLTKFHKDYLKKLNINNNVNVFPNFIRTITDKNIQKKEEYIVYAGRISNEKGVEELITTFLRLNYQDLKLKIIGDGPLLEILKNKYHSQNILFLGYLENKEVLKIIENSKAVITATKLYEGQPTLLCEASSMGVPSFFPDSGGIKEFFPSNYKLSYKQFDYDDLQKKLEILKNNQMLEEIGEDNKNFIKDYLSKEKLIETFKRAIND